MNTLSRSLYLCLLLIITGCVTTSGTVENGIYYSKSGSFEIPIPYPSTDLHISDIYNKSGEMVRFDVPYAYHHKLERVRIHQDADSDFVRSQRIEMQLQLAEANYFQALTDLDNPTDETLLSEIESLKGHTVLITIRRISNEQHSQIRGVLISIDESYVNTFHYTHPMFDEQDLERITTELKKFFGNTTFSTQNSVP